MANALGIDVYEGSGNIDWTQVVMSGRVFASIKSAEGVNYRDSRYKSNYEGAGAAGVLRMTYIYAHPNDSPRGTVDNLLGAIAGTSPELGIALDLEVTDGVSNTQLQAWVDAFAADLSAKNGEAPLDYSYPAFIHGHKLRFGLSKSCGLWIADYGVTSPPQGMDWAFWQYSSTGRVPGVQGNCDLDEFNGDVTALKAWAKAKGAIGMPYPTVKATVDGKSYKAIAVNNEVYLVWTAFRDHGANLTKIAYGDVEIGGKKPPQVTQDGNTYIIYSALPHESYTRHADGSFAFSTKSQTLKTVNERPVSVTLTYPDGSTQTFKA